MSKNTSTDFDGKVELIAETRSPIGKLLGFFLHNRLLAILLVLAVLGFGYSFAPFDWPWRPAGIEPVSVDSLPNLGENQQVVFTAWPGRSPQDVEDQVTYPLTTKLLGIKGVKSVRSTSMFGFSSIYVIFDDDTNFYDSRSLLSEKLQSISSSDLPDGIRPQLGPEATGLGQVFWYYLEGRDQNGNPTGGWDLEQLRTIQDWYIRYGLAAVSGVSEVASIGGYVREYQIDLEPESMSLYGIKIADVYKAVKNSNIDIGAKTVELNRVEYFVRGIGFIKSLEQLENCVVKIIDQKPVFLNQIASVSLGPQPRRGALDMAGSETVGGVVTIRFDANPSETIRKVKAEIKRLSPNLDRKAIIDFTQTSAKQIKKLANDNGFDAFGPDAKISSPQWLDYADSLLAAGKTLPKWLKISQVTIVPYYDRTKLIDETLFTLSDALRSQMMITFIVIILMMLHLRSSLLIGIMLPLTVAGTFIIMKLTGVQANIVALAGIAIAIGTIVDMGIVLCDNILRHLDQGPDNPSFAQRLIIIHNASAEVASAVLTAVLTTIIGFLPVFCLGGKAGKLFTPLAATKTFALVASILIALLVLPGGALSILRKKKTQVKQHSKAFKYILYALTLAASIILLSKWWLPVGQGVHLLFNIAFVVVIIAVLIGILKLFQHYYPKILRAALDHKLIFLLMPVTLLVLAVIIWSGMSREFMPEFDEGEFLWMPVISVHGSITEALDILQKQDQAISSIPEIKTVVGKIGRTDSPLDPAPLSMIETLISYKPEYRYENGKPIRQWRDHIKTPNDIWQEIVKAAKIPGSTIAAKGYPIQIRQVMLQTGMAAKMGIKIFGSDLEQISKAAMQMGVIMENAPNIVENSINVDQVFGKPYLVLDTTSKAATQRMKLYGVNSGDILSAVQSLVGGSVITTSVQGRERFNIRLRYQRELRDSLEAINNIRINTPLAGAVPLENIATFQFVRGPQVIRSENTFKVAYLTFDTQSSIAEVDAAAAIESFLQESIANGKLKLPAKTHYKLTGSFESEAKANATLKLVVPLSLAAIFVLLYMLFASVTTAIFVFSSVAVAFSGGFVLLWLYGQGWFGGSADSLLSIREIFQISPVNLSTAIWVGFLALFGIATDDGVVMGTYLSKKFDDNDAENATQCRELTVEAGCKRVRACLMTTATTILALLPVLSSHGRGSDLMIPMAIPTFGGMVIELMTMLVVPVLFCWRQERKISKT